MQKRLPSSPPCTHAQKSPLNCRKMLGRILRMVLMKEKLLFKGQWLKLPKHTTCAAGGSQKDKWPVTPLRWQAWLQSCWTNAEELIIWRGRTILLWKCLYFWNASVDCRWFGGQNCCAQKKSSACSLQQVWVIRFNWERWHGRQPDERGWCLLLPLTGPGAAGCIFTACSYLFLLLQRGGCRHSQWQWRKTFAAKCHVYAKLCVCLFCNLGSGFLHSWGWLLCVCRWRKYRCWCTSFGGNEHLRIAYKGGAVFSDNLFMIL